MKWFKVKALAVNGLKGKIHRSGDTVNENSFPPGNADELERKGFLEYLKSDSEVPNDNTGQPVVTLPTDITVDDVTIGEMKKDLKKAGVEFPKNASKVELFELWKKR